MCHSTQGAIADSRPWAFGVQHLRRKELVTESDYRSNLELLSFVVLLSAIFYIHFATSKSVSEGNSGMPLADASDYELSGLAVVAKE